MFDDLKKEKIVVEISNLVEKAEKLKLISMHIANL